MLHRAAGPLNTPGLEKSRKRYFWLLAEWLSPSSSASQSSSPSKTSPESDRRSRFKRRGPFQLKSGKIYSDISGRPLPLAQKDNDEMTGDVSYKVIFRLEFYRFLLPELQGGPRGFTCPPNSNTKTNTYRFNFRENNRWWSECSQKVSVKLSSKKVFCNFFYCDGSEWICFFLSWKILGMSYL